MTRIFMTMAVAGAAVFGHVLMANAQTATGSSKSIEALLRDGFEIKAAAPNGKTFVVFLQKGEEAYACEFVTVTNSRCGAIN
mgnify:CR=1 FL=1